MLFVKCHNQLSNVAMIRRTATATLSLSPFKAEHYRTIIEDSQFNGLHLPWAVMLWVVEERTLKNKKALVVVAKT